MLELTFRDLNDMQFNDVLRKLGSTGAYTNKKAFKNVFKLLKNISSEQKLARSMHTAILKDHAELDEKGELKPDEVSKRPYVILDGKKDLYNAAMESFMSNVIELDCLPVRLEDIPDGTLSPNEVLVLEPLLDIE